MATYIQGLTDYIPQIQPFKPDLNFYSKVLQAKQDKYDAAKYQIGSLYGSLLYGRLSREGNIKRRDDFFKNIEQQIKKISSMDLSLAQNENAAMKIFDPLINDRKISHDYSYTKNIMGEMERGENFRYCTDPKKCGGNYNPEAMTYLNLKLEEYANADDNTALSMNIGEAKFVPYNNMVKDAIDWAKATGFLVEGVDKQGGYIIKKQNGEIIKTPLIQLFQSVFGQDPKYREQYKVSAYLNKYNWVNENLEMHNGDRNQAESAYYTEIINNTIKSLKEDIKAHKEISDAAKLRAKATKNKATRDGVSVSDGSVIQQMISTQEDKQITDETDKYYNDLEQRINNLAINIDDKRVLANIVESIVADGLIKSDLTRATEELAKVWNTTTGIEENQFALNAQTHAQRIKEMEKAFDLDVDKAIELARIEIGKETALTFLEGGLPDDQEGTPEFGGPGNSTAAGNVDMFKMTQQENLDNYNAVYKNQKLYNTTIITSLKAIADNINMSGEERLLARKELKSMLGNFYDDKNNMFVKDGMKYTDYGQMTLDRKNELQVYSNAKIVLERNKYMLRSTIPTAMTLSDRVDHAAKMRDSYGNILYENNKIVKEGAAAYKGLDNSERILFDNLFNDVGNGRFTVITSEDAYVRKMMGAKFNKNISMESKEKFLRKSYKKMFELYKNMHNNGAEYGINGIKDPYGSGIGSAMDGGQTANGMSWTSNYLTPNSYGNKGFISFMKNVGSSPQGTTKALVGTGHIDKEYADNEDNSAARALFQQYRSGLMSGAYTTEGAKQQAPRAKVTYNNVAASSGNMVSVSLTDINPEWLKSIATDKDKTKIGETNISSFIENGATMYMTKEAADNLFTNRFKQKPGDVYINSGMTYQLSRPDGGSASIKKVGNMIVINGELIGYDGGGNRRTVSLANSFPMDVTTSGEKLINAYTELINEQETKNVNYLQNGGQPMYYDEESLMKALQEKMSPQARAISSRINLFNSLIGK